MAVSISGTVVTISSFKDGVTATSAIDTVVSTTGVFATSDVGRKIAVKYVSGNSATTQVRTIVARLNSTTVRVHDDWIGLPPVSATWIMSHSLQDVHNIGHASLEKSGDRSYRWNADWLITADGFLAGEDLSLEMYSQSGTGWDINSGGIVEFGKLWGGEGNGSTETTNGCHLVFKTNRTNQSIYSGSSSRHANGGVVNYYGCLVDSRATGSGWMFQRMRGATRFIGSVFDGIMGGRFHHEASEWVECRHSGNNNSAPAWSLGAAFARDINSVKFYRNLMCAKSLKAFSGTFRNCEFSDSNGKIFLMTGNTSSAVINFVDSTTFDGSAVTDGGSNTLRQKKSVNYRTVDSSGNSLLDVKVAIEDKNQTLQEVVSTSDASGIVPEILTTFRDMVATTASIDFFPFTVRLRIYGKVYQQFVSDIPEKIVSDVGMLNNNAVTLTEAAASAVSGVAIDATLKTITVTSSVTSSELYDYSQWWAYQTANMQEDEPLLTVDGVNYNLNTGWKLILGTEISGGLSITGDVEMSAVADLTDHNINGTLAFTVAGTYAITDSIITSVDNTSSGNITINSSGSTSITNNLNPSTIAISNPVTVSINGCVVGKPVYVFEIATGSIVIDEIALTPTVSALYILTGGDVQVRIRHRVSSIGDTIKKRYTSVDTITSTGLNHNINLTNDTLAA